MTTSYSSYSAAWKPSGATVSRKYRAKLVTSVTETATTYIINAEVYAEVNTGVNADFNGRLTFSDSMTITGNGSTTTGITSRRICNYSKTFSKDSASYQVSITGGVSSTNGAWTGVVMSTTQYFTVPALNGYSINYNANTPSEATSEVANLPQTQSKYYNTPVVLRDNVPTLSGYVFHDWNTSADGTGTSYNPGDRYTQNASVVLYAQWLKKFDPTSDNIVIKFSVNGQALKLDTDLHKVTITSDTINHFVCKFEFDSSWNGYDIRAYFKNASFNITKPSVLYANGYCCIPWEVLAHTGVILCNVVGIKYVDGEPVRLTAGPVKLFMHNPGSEEQLLKKIAGDKATIDPLNVFVQKEEGALEPDYQLTPTLTEYEQYVSIVKHYRDEIIASQSVSRDYLNLINKPQIEGVTLVNNKSFEDLTLVYLTNLEIESLLN